MATAEAQESITVCRNARTCSGSPGPEGGFEREVSSSLYSHPDLPHQIPPNSLVHLEETFGAMASVIAAGNLEEAVATANANPLRPRSVDAAGEHHHGCPRRSPLVGT